MSWILNADIILKILILILKKILLSQLLFKQIILKNFKYEIDYQKRIEVITALILSGLVLKNMRTILNMV